MASFCKKIIAVVVLNFFLQLGLAYHFTLDKFNPFSSLTLSSDVRNGDFLFLHRYENWKYWSDFHLGFPDVSIGFIFPTFRFVVKACTFYRYGRRTFTNAIYGNYILHACHAHHAAIHCARIHSSQFRDPDSETLHNKKADGYCYDLYKRMYRRQYSIFFTSKFRDSAPKSNLFKIPDGTLDEKTLKYIESIFKGCKKAAENWCNVMSVSRHECPAPYRFCGFGKFAEMYLRAEIHRSKHRCTAGISDATNLSAMFLYFYCQQKWVRGEPLCPYPCVPNLNPCLTKKNTYLHRCLTISGVHKSDFRCMCLKGFRWDSYSQECKEHNLCLEPDSRGYPCHRPGTKRCLYAPLLPNSPTHSCSCLDRFMGLTCDKVRDPCIQRFDRKLPAGRDACRSRQGGRCTSRIGSDYYTCKCPDGWGHDDQYKFSNCFKKFFGCDKVLCFNGGKCRESPDGSVVLCVCPGEWEGPHCEVLHRGEWLHWEPWASCSVDCGQGWSFRRRQCRTGLDSDCGGSGQQIRECEAPCQGLEEKYIPIVKMLQYLHLTLIAIAAISLLFGLILRFRLPLIKELVAEKRENLLKEMVKQRRHEEEDKLEQYVMGAISKLDI